MFPFNGFSYPYYHSSKTGRSSKLAKTNMSYRHMVVNVTAEETLALPAQIFFITSLSYDNSNPQLSLYYSMMKQI